MPADAMQMQYALGVGRGGSRRRTSTAARTGSEAWLLPWLVPQETTRMAPGPNRGTNPTGCEIPSSGLTSTAGSAWSSPATERVDAKQRLSRLARTLEADVIPRLVGTHARSAPVLPKPAEIESFVELLRTASDSDLSAAVDALQVQGWRVEAIYLGLLAPAARLLGEQWENDRCDFSTVTICLGRLQRLLRQWSPEFGREIDHPPNGRRILLAQHPDEQHSFGLSMVAEFFRRDGWEVLGGVGGSVPDPSAQVSRDWFDAVGFSIGSQTRLEWLRERIVQVRASSRNRAVVVLVGGPLLTLNPEVAGDVGADGFGADGGQAPQVAENLLTERLQRR